MGGSSLTGGAIPGQFKVWQMHAHWGSCAGHGSEHTVNGKQYDAELHIVHFNTKYGTPENAADKPDGLAVLGIFIEEGKEHPESAIWTVFKEHITMSEEQVKAMRCMKITCEDEDSDSDGGDMVDNYRPPCPVGGRVVRVSS